MEGEGEKPPVLEYDIHFGEDNDELYRTFVGDLRIRLRDGTVVILGERKNVLPKEVSGASPKFEPVKFTIQDQGRAVDFLLNKTNLYLVGFKKSEDAQWIELPLIDQNGKPKQLIDGSKLFSVEGSYIKLKNKCGVNFKMSDLRFGRENLSGALTYLHKTGANELLCNAKVCCKTLLLFIVLICESTRFQCITDEIAPQMNQATGAALSEGYHKIFTKWDAYSNVLHKNKSKSPDTKLKISNEEEEEEEITGKELNEKMGMLKAEKVDANDNQQSAAQKGGRKRNPQPAWKNNRK